eukprot:COSAG03_NODE_6391_length_1067_cov_2.439050_2_plen_72_part_01
MSGEGGCAWAGRAQTHTHTHTDTHTDTHTHTHRDTPSPPGKFSDIMALIGSAQLPFGPKSPLNQDASIHRPS